jgi:hypothetical protein
MSEEFLSNTRREFLAKATKASLLVPPTVGLLMAATTKPAEAAPPYHAPAHGFRRRTEGEEKVTPPGRR